MKRRTLLRTYSEDTYSNIIKFNSLTVKYLGSCCLSKQKTTPGKQLDMVRDFILVTYKKFQTLSGNIRETQLFYRSTGTSDKYSNRDGVWFPFNGITYVLDTQSIWFDKGGLKELSQNLTHKDNTISVNYSAVVNEDGKIFDRITPFEKEYFNSNKTNDDIVNITHEYKRYQNINKRHFVRQYQIPDKQKFPLMYLIQYYHFKINGFPNRSYRRWNDRGPDGGIAAFRILSRYQTDNNFIISLLLGGGPLWTTQDIFSDFRKDYIRNKFDSTITNKIYEIPSTRKFITEEQLNTFTGPYTEYGVSLTKLTEISNHLYDKLTNPDIKQEIANQENIIKQINDIELNIKREINRPFTHKIIQKMTKLDNTFLDCSIEGYQFLDKLFTDESVYTRKQLYVVVNKFSRKTKINIDKQSIDNYLDINPNIPELFDENIKIINNFYQDYKVKLNEQLVIINKTLYKIEKIYEILNIKDVEEKDNLQMIFRLISKDTQYMFLKKEKNIKIDFYELRSLLIKLWKRDSKSFKLFYDYLKVI